MASVKINNSFDVVVIGAGIEGSCTAYQLARGGIKTVLLEQFLLPHTKGSSHGKSRIIRKFYEDEVYMKMMNDAFEEWSQIEKITDQELYKASELLVVIKHNDPKHRESITKSLIRNNVRHKVFTNKDEVHSQFPMLKYEEPVDLFVLDHEAGILKADKCLKAVQELFETFGGTLHDGEKVLKIIPGSMVTIQTNRTTYQAKHVVITAGPWTSHVLHPLKIKLPLKPLRVMVCYFKEKIPGTYAISHAPTTIYGNFSSDLHQDLYTLPSYEYPGHMKVAFHDGPEIDPDCRDEEPETSKRYIQLICEHVRDHFPGLENIPSITEACIYTVTPDKGFILDYHPMYRNIVIGAGFSGHGFKFGPVVGKLLKQLVTGETPSHDMKPLSMKRFNKIPNSSL